MKANYARDMRYFPLKMRKAILHVMEMTTAALLSAWKVQGSYGMKACFWATGDLEAVKAISCLRRCFMLIII